MEKRIKKFPKIREMRVTPIAITDPPLLNAAGLHAPYALRTVIELVTDDNISGISEIPGSKSVNDALQEAAELITGKDPWQLNELFELMKSRFSKEKDHRGDQPWDKRKLVHIFSAVEVACLDIIGKVCERPVVDLLGGKCREEVPFAAYLFYKREGAGGVLEFNKDPDAAGWSRARQEQSLTPEEIVTQARAMCREYGFRSVKLKGGVFHPEEESEAIFALRREFGPGMPLRFDPNALWSPETGIKYGKILESALEYLEDPVRGQENMSIVRKRLKIPLATNMCTTSFEDLPGSINLGSEDIILCDHHFWGGLRSCMHLSKIAATFNRSLSMHSNSHLGISLAAMVHLGAAIPRLDYALDTHYPWQSEEIINEGPLKFQDGAVAVPKGPGLGVTLNRVSLEKLNRNYRECGLTERNDEKEMQKIEPGWTFKATRW
jgi:glucarate dehydratase